MLRLYISLNAIGEKLTITANFTSTLRGLLWARPMERWQAGQAVLKASARERTAGIREAAVMFLSSTSPLWSLAVRRREEVLLTRLTKPPSGS